MYVSEAAGDASGAGPEVGAECTPEAHLGVNNGIVCVFHVTHISKAAGQMEQDREGGWVALLKLIQVCTVCIILCDIIYYMYFQRSWRCKWSKTARVGGVHS